MATDLAPEMTPPLCEEEEEGSDGGWGKEDGSANLTFAKEEDGSDDGWGREDESGLEKSRSLEDSSLFWAAAPTARAAFIGNPDFAGVGIAERSDPRKRG